MICVVKERLIISMLVGATMSIHPFSRLVGIGSISHDFLQRFESVFWFHPDLFHEIDGV